MNATSFNRTQSPACYGFIGDYIATNPKIEPYFALYVVNCVVNGVSSITAILGNALLITAILTTPSLNTPSYWLITSQAATDLAMGFFQLLVISLMISELQNDIRSFCILGNISLFVSFFLLSASGCSLTAISVDRMLAIRLKMRYKTVVTFARVRHSIVLLWIASLALATVGILLAGHKPVTIMFFGFAAVCSCIITYSYANALKCLSAHVCEAANKVDPSTTSNSSSPLDVNKYRRSLCTVLLIEIVLLISAVPISITWIYMFVKGINVESIVFMYSATTVLSLNSSINPFIYLSRMKDIRQACTAVLRKFKH